MKILLINNSFGNFGGGSEKATYESGKLFREKGYEVFFFSCNKKPYYEENYEYSSFFPEDFAKNKIRNTTKIFYNFEAEKKLNKLIQTIKPDIVHVNCIQHNLSASVLVSCKKNKIPTVMTFHDSHFACPCAALMKGNNDYCSNMDCINGNVFSCLKNKCFNNSLLKSSIVGLEFLFRKKMNFYKIPEAFICPSKFLFDIAVKSGFKQENLYLINNFVNNEYLEIKPSYSDKNYFLYVGRLVKEKGLEHLLKAFSKLPEIKLRIVGEGHYRSELEKIAADLNLKNVEFLGFKNGKDLDNEYKNCIATILPSVCSEIFGLTIIESFAHGKPVIASNIGGIPEIIQHNFNGLLVSPGNSEEIKEAVLKLNNDKNLVLNLGICARKTLEEKYNPELYFEKLKNIYETLIKKHQKYRIKQNFLEQADLNNENLICK